MNDDVIQDLKQFISAELHQQTEEIRGDITETRDDISGIRVDISDLKTGLKDLRIKWTIYLNLWLML